MVHSMEKKQLYMIGNSHIDPVWFWNWEEGMQEVKSTYASALARMREFPDFKFTSTSTAFLEWIEGIVPEMFEEIRRRVEEGRFELTGGWFIEPDCILPCGEAFVRQGLYSQRYLKDRFGKTSQIGSNVDSFGHNPVLPQILKKSGMDAYVFMRPRLDTPVFLWESADGSQVRALSLPAEYTTWFHDPTVKNIENTLERTKGYDRMPCCYGVGNHGGGPTIENIESILALKDSFPDTQLCFSTFTDYFQDTAEDQLPVIRGAFEKVNEGCYSIDSAFKALNRKAEGRLIATDSLMSSAAVLRGSWMKETQEMEKLWKSVLFNEFHDTMGGTAIKSARDEALMQLSGVCARAGALKAAAIQHMVNSVDTTGVGFPLFVFNTSGESCEGIVEAELEWFCQSPLKLLNPEGKEIAYQRIHTDAKVRHTTLGGRRRFLFQAQVPAFGFAVYRTLKEEPSLCSTPQMEIDNPDSSCLENAYLRAQFDPVSGELTSLIEKETGYEALSATAHMRLYVDERDAWGGLQGRKYEDRQIRFLPDTKDGFPAIEKVESGELRECIRVRSRFEDTVLEQLYYLGRYDRELKVENRLRFSHTWHLLKAAFPVRECVETLAETAYGTLKRSVCDKDEYFMQRFVDIRDQNGCGLAVANDGKYAFNIQDGRLQITAARSAIYAQGNSKDWYNPKESYQYTDIGEQTFTFFLKPHGRSLPNSSLYTLAAKLGSACEYLADSIHPGNKKLTNWSLLWTDEPGVKVMEVKKAEDDDACILRLLETDGKDTSCNLTFLGRAYPITIGHNEILTLKADLYGEGSKTPETVNLIEWNAQKAARE